MKDKEYFKAIVEPFIKDKIEKTLVDEFLLGQDISHYAISHSKYGFVCDYEWLLLFTGISNFKYNFTCINHN